MSKEYNGVIRYSDNPRTNSKNSDKRSNPTSTSKKGKILKGILIGVGICIIIAIAAVIFLFLTRKKLDIPPETSVPSTTSPTTIPGSSH